MMSESVYTFMSLDLPALLTSSFAAISCALLGNFLLLRRMSLMGDAISHSVLPGIVLAFLFSGSRSAMPVFLGAAVAGVITTILVELISRLGRVESGAAMGVVFSVLFALGVLLIEQAAARAVDLDAECLLHGQMETIFWYPPRDWEKFFELSSLRMLPQEVMVSLIIAALTFLFVTILFKELTITSFDPALALALGLRVGVVHYAFMVAVAAAVVASFEAVGSILVISMLICPAVVGRFFTDRLRVQLVLSVVVGVAAVWIGYYLASFGPQYFGSRHALNAAGMIASVLGVMVAFSLTFAPRYGFVGAIFRRFILGLRIAREDLLSVLYRLEESIPGPERTARTLRILSMLPGGPTRPLALLLSKLRGEIFSETSGYVLTDKGRDIGKSLVRKHRLWESFLVEELDLRPDHVHGTAAVLEHFTTSDLARKLDSDHQGFDPHGYKIPKE